MENNAIRGRYAAEVQRGTLALQCMFEGLRFDDEGDSLRMTLHVDRTQLAEAIEKEQLAPELLTVCARNILQAAAAPADFKMNDPQMDAINDAAETYSRTHSSDSFCEALAQQAEALVNTNPALRRSMPETLRADNTQHSATDRPTILMKKPNIISQITSENIDLETVFQYRFQWETLKRTLQHAGANIIVAQGKDLRDDDQSHGDSPGGRADQYTRDPLFIDAAGTVYLPRFDVPGREVFGEEQPSIMAELIASGALNNTNEQKKWVDTIEEYRPRIRPRIKHLDIAVEGGDIVVDAKRNQLFMGYSVKEGFSPHDSDKLALEKAEALERATGMKVIPVPRVDGTFFHLDTFMAVLPHGEVAIYPDATNRKGMTNIREALGADPKIYKLGRSSAYGMATNLVAVGNNVVMTADDTDLREALAQWKYNVITPQTVGLEPGFSWQIGQGGARCLTSFPLPARGAVAQR